MYTLTLLDYTAELIELTYELGAFTRTRILPAIIAAYVMITMAIDYVRGLRGPTRSQMIQDLTREWKSISLLDPTTNGSDTPEFTEWLQTLTDDELKQEFASL